MIIKKEISLGLHSIQLCENPAAGKGRFVEYLFDMDWPQERYLVKPKKETEEGDISIIYGGSPKVCFYKKDTKRINNIIINIIKQNMPLGFDITELREWKIVIKDYTCKDFYKKWCVFYIMRTGFSKSGVRTICEKHISLDESVMREIIGQLEQKIGE